MITAPEMDIILSLISILLSSAVPQSGQIITKTLATDQHDLTMRRLVNDYYKTLFSPGRGEDDLIVLFQEQHSCSNGQAPLLCYYLKITFCYFQKTLDVSTVFSKDVLLKILILMYFIFFMILLNFQTKTRKTFYIPCFEMMGRVWSFCVSLG